jgi:hypothetical protein
MPRSRKCGRESSSHRRAAASQLVTFASRRAGILVGRQELLIWGTTKQSSSACSSTPSSHSRPRPSTSSSWQESSSLPAISLLVGLMQPHALGITVGCRPPAPARHQSSSQMCRSNRKARSTALGSSTLLGLSPAITSQLLEPSGHRFFLFFPSPILLYAAKFYWN